MDSPEKPQDRSSKHLSRTIAAAGASALILGATFYAGAYIGSNDSFLGAKFRSASAQEQVDLTAFWKVWQAIDEKFVPASSTDEVTTEERINGAIQGMVSSLNDPYTVFLPPSEKERFEDDISGSFEGVGMEVGMRNGVITVISPLKGTPAEKAGIKAGDIIIQIDDQSTSDMTVDDAVELIRGSKGEPVKFTIVRKDLAEPLLITVVRDVIEMPTIDTELRDDGVFVIQLYSFSAVSPQLFRNALRDFVTAKTDKLILDLRGNPGGYLEAAVDMASWFLPTGKVVVSEDFGPNSEKEAKLLRSKGYNIFNDNLKLVVLVDEGSASASEILAGALQSHDVATLVGTQTFGKGSVQQLIDITDDTALKVTIARWLTPDGLSISANGLTPDIEIQAATSTASTSEETIDIQLEKAADVVKSL